MFKKKRKKEQRAEEVKSPPLSEKLQEILRERDLHDDHGPVIVGNRKDKPKL